MGGLIESCAKQGWLRLGLAWIGDRPIAAQFWMVANGRAEIYKLAYDEAYSRFSVGSVLTALMMKHVLEHDDVHEIDYLIGDDAYKKTWVNQRRERWGLIAYDTHHWRGMLGLARESAGRTVKAIGQVLARAKIPA
jgi:CelD/BcsL family acetyltransferase involved in cellulose biosynthesis